MRVFEQSNKTVLMSAFIYQFKAQNILMCVTVILQNTCLMRSVTQSCDRWFFLMQWRHVPWPRPPAGSCPCSPAHALSPAAESVSVCVCVSGAGIKALGAVSRSSCLCHRINGERWSLRSSRSRNTRWSSQTPETSTVSAFRLLIWSEFTSARALLH